MFILNLVPAKVYTVPKGIHNVVVHVLCKNKIILLFVKLSLCHNFGCIVTSPILDDGGMKRLQICMFDSDFYLQQVQILHLDVKVENVQLQKSFFFNLKKTTFT